MRSADSGPCHGSPLWPMASRGDCFPSLARSLIDEAQVVMEATEIEILPSAALGLAALRGDEADALERVN